MGFFRHVFFQYIPLIHISYNINVIECDLPQIAYAPLPKQNASMFNVAFFFLDLEGEFSCLNLALILVFLTPRYPNLAALCGIPCSLMYATSSLQRFVQL